MADDIRIKLGVELDDAMKSIDRFKSKIIKDMSDIQTQTRRGSVTKNDGFLSLTSLKSLPAVKKHLQDINELTRIASSNAKKMVGVDSLGLLGQDKKKVDSALKSSNLQFQTGLLGSEELKIFKTHLSGLNQEFGKSLTTQQKYAEALRRTKAEISSMKQPFQGWALSIMFAGMAIKNAMNQIWTSSQKTFQDVMHSVEGTTTGFDMLQGSMAYLGFTVGQALEPIAYMLVPIVDAMSELITNNPDTTRGIFLLLTTLGTAAAVGGSIVLAKAGFGEMLDIVGKLVGYDVNKWLSKNFTGQKFGASLAVLWSLEQAVDAFKDFQEGGDFITGLERTLSSLAAATGGWLLWKGKTKAGGAALAIAVGADWLADNTFFQNAGWAVGWLVAAFATGMENIKSKWSQGWKGIVATIIDALTPITSLLGFLGISIGSKLVGLEPEFDWSKTFLEHMRTINSSMRAMDQDLANYKKDVMDPFLIKDMKGNSLSDDYVTTLLDTYDFKDENKLLPAIGTLQINVQQNNNETNYDFASRIAEAMRKELERATG